MKFPLSCLLLITASLPTVATPPGDGYIEATVDLIGLLGYVPSRVYAVVAAYETADGGRLVVPAHN